LKPAAFFMQLRARHLLFGLGELALAGTAAAIAASASLAGFMKLLHPDHWRLWVAPRMRMWGVLDDPTIANELLGSRVYLVALLASFLGAMAAKEAWGYAQGHFRQAR
jgi:hypothetical protein